ncbi:hypothetical protein ACFUC1_00080 [Pedococcus sp. NPDC057267]|uniref:hypothetical protein n=1 Tax=Pedococcus sp. NPDC057267 TaxID=3346077 RepID=UPI003636923B
MRRWFAGGDRTLWVIVGAVAAGAAAILGVLAARGSWYTDDLDFLVDGARGFSPGALLTPVNDHVVPGLRLVYAVFAAVAPLNYAFTVGVRVVLWAVACVLMGALAQRLLLRTGPAVLATVLYAFSPVVMPSFMSLSSATNNLPAHVLGLVFLHLSLDWARRGRVRDLVGAAVALFGSLLFWEKSGLVALTGLAVVMVAHTRLGRARVVIPWSLAVLVPGAAFGALFLARRQQGTVDLPDPQTLLSLFGQALQRAVLPAVAGGPWSWSPSNPPFFGFADPPAGIRWAGAVVLVLAIGATAAFGRRYLWFWVAVLLYSVGTTLVVSLGRFSTFGNAFTAHYHYWSDLAIPLSLALAASAACLPVRAGRPLRVVALPVAAAWACVQLVSMAGFGDLWSRNPAGAYVASLSADLNERQGTNLWDVSMPGDVVPGINAHRTVAGLLPLLGDNRTTIQDSGTTPYGVDEHGRVRPATLKAWGSGVVPPDCGMRIHGSESVRVPLSAEVPEGQWFARISYLANVDTRVRVVLDGDKGAVPLEGGPAVWPAGLANAYLRAASPSSATAVTISGLDDDATVCVGSVEVGAVELSK